MTSMLGTHSCVHAILVRGVGFVIMSEDKKRGGLGLDLLYWLRIKMGGGTDMELDFKDRQGSDYFFQGKRPFGLGDA